MGKNKFKNKKNNKTKQTVNADEEKDENRQIQQVPVDNQQQGKKQQQMISQTDQQNGQKFVANPADKTYQIQQKIQQANQKVQNQQNNLEKQQKVQSIEQIPYIEQVRVQEPITQKQEQKQQNSQKPIYAQQTIEKSQPQNRQANLQQIRYQNQQNLTKISQGQFRDNYLTKLQTQNGDYQEQEQHNLIQKIVNKNQNKIEQASQQMEVSQKFIGSLQNSKQQPQTKEVHDSEISHKLFLRLGQSSIMQQSQFSQSAKLDSKQQQQQCTNTRKLQIKLAESLNLCQFQDQHKQNQSQPFLSILEQNQVQQRQIQSLQFQRQIQSAQLQPGQQMQSNQNNYISQSKQPQFGDQSQKRDEQVQSQSNQKQSYHNKTTNKLYHSMSLNTDAFKDSKIRENFELHHAHSEVFSVQNDSQGIDQPNRHYTSSSYAFLINKLKNSPSKKSNSKNSRKDNQSKNYSEQSSPKKSQRRVIEKDGSLSENERPNSGRSHAQRQIVYQKEQAQRVNLADQNKQEQKNDNLVLLAQPEHRSLGSGNDQEFQEQITKDQDQQPDRSKQSILQQSTRQLKQQNVTVEHKIQTNRYQNLSQIPAQSLSRQQSQEDEREQYQTKNSKLQVSIVQKRAVGQDQPYFKNQSLTTSKLGTSNLPNINQTDQYVSNQYQIPLGVTSLRNVHSIQSVQSIQNPSINDLRNPVIKTAVSGVSEFQSYTFISKQILPVTEIQQRQQQNGNQANYNQQGQLIEKTYNDAESPIKKHMKEQINYQSSQQASPEKLDINSISPRTNRQKQVQQALDEQKIGIQPSPRILLNMPAASPIRQELKNNSESDTIEMKIQEQPIQHLQYKKQSRIGIDKQQNQIQNAIQDDLTQNKNVSPFEPQNFQDAQNQPDQLSQSENIENIYENINQDNYQMQNFQEQEWLACQANAPVQINTQVLANSRRQNKKSYQKQVQDDQQSDKGIDHDDFNLDDYESRPIQSPQRQKHIENQVTQPNTQEQITTVEQMLVRSRQLIEKQQTQRKVEQNKQEQFDKELRGSYKTSQTMPIKQNVVQIDQMKQKTEYQQQSRPQFIQKSTQQTNNTNGQQKKLIKSQQANKITTDPYVPIQSQNINVTALSGSSNYQRLSSGPATVIRISANSRSNAPLTIGATNFVNNIKGDNQAFVNYSASNVVTTSIDNNGQSKNNVQQNKMQNINSSIEDKPKIFQEVKSNEPIQIELSLQNFKKTSPTKSANLQQTIYQIKASPNIKQKQHLPFKVQNIQISQYVQQRQLTDRESSTRDLKDFQDIQILSASKQYEIIAQNLVAENRAPAFQQLQESISPAIQQLGRNITPAFSQNESNVPVFQQPKQKNITQIKKYLHEDKLVQAPVTLIQELDPIRKSMNKLQQYSESINQDQNQFRINSTIYTTNFYRDQPYYKYYTRKSQQASFKNTEPLLIEGVKHIDVNLKFGNSQNKLNRAQLLKKQTESQVYRKEDQNHIHHLGNRNYVSFNQTFSFNSARESQKINANTSQMPFQINTSPKLQNFRIKTENQAIDNRYNQNIPIESYNSNQVQNDKRKIEFDYQHYQNYKVPHDSQSSPEEKRFLPIPRRSEQTKTHSITLFREKESHSNFNQQNKWQNQTVKFNQVSEFPEKGQTLNLQHNFAPKLPNDLYTKPAASIYVRDIKKVTNDNSPPPLKRDSQNVQWLDISRQAGRSNNLNYSFQTGSKTNKKYVGQKPRIKLNLVSNSNQSSPSNPLPKLDHSKQLLQRQQQKKQKFIDYQQKINLDQFNHQKGVSLTPNKFFFSKSKSKDNIRNNQNKNRTTVNQNDKKNGKTKIKLFVAKKNCENLAKNKQDTQKQIQNIGRMVRQTEEKIGKTYINKGLNGIQIVESDYNTARNEEVNRKLHSLNNETLDLRGNPSNQFIRKAEEEKAGIFQKEQRNDKIQYRMNEKKQVYYDYDMDAAICPQKLQKKFKDISPVKGLISQTHGKTNFYYIQSKFNKTDYQIEKREKSKNQMPNQYHNQWKTGISKIDKIQKNAQFIRQKKIKSPRQTPSKPMGGQSRERAFPEINKYTPQQIRRNEIKGVPKVFFNIKQREHN